MLLLRSLRTVRPYLVTGRSVALKSAPKSAPIRPFILTRGGKSQPLISLRFKSSTTAPPEPPAKPPTQPHAFIYPSRLCVYHAGIGRVLFLGFLKLSTIFMFAFFGLVVTPACYEKEGLSTTVAGTALSAIVPLVFVAYTTAPFVASVHLRVPTFARQSEELLRRYIRALPGHTELEIATLSLVAKPRVSIVPVGELAPAPAMRRFGIVTFVRDTSAENAKRKWYVYRAVGDFTAQRASGTKRVPWAWETIWDRVHAAAR
ncbi:hypothetical protein F4777DRAFT_583538 [Nemania sp. FL0916]|nr:hypothetical protein F4777DRAFT_583538 [Nemania sp. FL0916]